ncbi:MAG TPA: PEGA domain-containing protein, partial [Thermoplasmatales archaeon]|nr:PEGA domain-containing protein [Thermoplasmatales archaeon]
MKWKVIVSILFVSILIVSSFSATTLAAYRKIVRPSHKVFEDTGVIQKIGDKYLIKGDRGVRFMGKLWRLYDPLNLPKSFRVDGMGVKFRAKIVAYRLRGLMNFLIYRYLPIEIIKIDSLERIKGFVIDKATHKPVPGAKIILESRVPPLDWKVLDECISDGKGRYELKSVDLDLKMSYRVRASKEGYRNFEYFLSPIPSGKTRFLNISLISIKERFSIDYPKDGDVVSGRIVIRGKIYDSEIKSIEVSIDRGEWRKATIYWLGFPNPDNVIAIWQYEWDTREVTNGEHLIGVRAWDGEVYVYKSVRIKVYNGENSIIYGQVVEAAPILVDSSETGESCIPPPRPIPHARVAAYPIYHTTLSNDSTLLHPPYVTYTDENGMYELKLPSGGYRVEVTKEGYEKSSKSVYVKPGEVKKLDFELRRVWSTAILYGKVMELSSGIGIPNATVTAYLKYPPIDMSIPVRYTAKTDPQGRYVLEVFSPGEYVVKAFKKGYKPARKELMLQPHEVKRLDFRLQKINPYISLVYPNGGERLSRIVNIYWKLNHHLIPRIPLAVDIQYCYGKGRWMTIVRDYDARKPPYQWDTTNVPDGDLYRIRVVLKSDPDFDGIYEKILDEDTSDRVFTVCNGVIEDRGTVKYVDLEGGFYGIISSSGKKYFPLNLPEEFYQDGLRVIFRAEILKDYSGIYMWGTPIEITKIEVETSLYKSAIRGHVYDADFCRPITGAKVVLEKREKDPPYQRWTALSIYFTQRDGFYEVSANMDEESCYRLKVFKNGYRIYYYTLPHLEPNEEFLKDIYLISQSKVIYVDESYNGKDIYLNMNQYLNLTLIQNPSTGYRWDFVDFNDSIMEIVNHFCWGYPQHDPPILGASCNETWILKPLKSCDFELKLKYWRPWEPNNTLKTFNLNIH